MIIDNQDMDLLLLEKELAHHENDIYIIQLGKVQKVKERAELTITIHNSTEEPHLQPRTKRRECMHLYMLWKSMKMESKRSLWECKGRYDRQQSSADISEKEETS